MPRRRNVRTNPQPSPYPYPYPIPPFDVSRLKKSDIRFIEEKQFFLIEALLRSSVVMEAYSHDRKKFDALWSSYGVFSRNPLAGSHHALLQNDDGLNQALHEMGYIDAALGILDLGIIAKLPPQHTITYGAVTLDGPWCGGADECRMRLQASNPHELHLRIDASYPPRAIIKVLEALLRDLHGKINMDKPAGHSGNPKRTVRPDDVLGKMNYFKCYDLSRQGHTVEDIAKRTYDQNNGAAEETVRTNIRRAKRMIKEAEKSIRFPFVLH